MENETQTYTMARLPNETLIQYDFFLQFLDLGSIHNVYKSHNCNISERMLYYLSKQNHWKERKTRNYEAQKLGVLAERAEILVNLKSRQINNIISASESLESLMEGVLVCVPKTMEEIYKKVSKEPTKILHYAINMNNLFKMYSINQDRLNKKLEEGGVTFENLNPLLDDISFGTEYDKVLSEIEEDEKTNFNEDFENLVKDLYPHLIIDKDIKFPPVISKPPKPILDIKESNYGIPNKDEVDWDEYYKSLDEDDAINDRKFK